MKKVLLSDLNKGMITAADVITSDGHLIVPKGVVLTDNIIAKLFSFNIIFIQIADKMLEEIEDINETLQLTYSEKLKASPEYVAFKGEFENTLNSFETAVNSLVTQNSEFKPEQLLDHTLSMIQNRDSLSSLMDMILHMNEYDDCTFSHSINVALICNIFAGWLRYSEEDRQLATACGLFHDIGKIMIPKEILYKKSMLTTSEFKLVQSHPLHSYKLLARYSISEEVKNAALMHHERSDGSGYPYGFTDDKIASFAKLVAIVDVYEAMTSSRSYRKSLSPFDVISFFENDGLQKYDPKMLLTFLENVVNTFVNQKVKLSNGVEGDIIYINPVYLSKPTIKVGNSFVDLTTLNDVKITEIL